MIMCCLIRALADLWGCDTLVLSNGGMLISKGKLKKLG
jgi:hypothetical protein